MKLWVFFLFFGEILWVICVLLKWNSFVGVYVVIDEL